MGDAAVSGAFEAFLIELRAVLPHLYDPLELQESPLFALFEVPTTESPIPTLRQILMDAIQALKPGANVPVHSGAWRIFHILRYRYVEQSAQRTVANNLNLSVRQLRRQERDAEEALANYLWTRYGLQRRAEAVFGTGVAAQTGDLAGNGGRPGRERELEWVRASFPSEITDVAETIDSTVKTVDPLIRALNVQVVRQIPDDLPPVTGQRVLLRQAFLSLLTAAIHSVPGGQVRVRAEQQAEGIVVCVDTGSVTGSTSPVEEGDEHLQMARECIGLFGGELVDALPVQGEPSFATALRLPVTKPVRVLAIDDNLDTLQLFQRFLSGTRYQCIAVHDPELALTVAEAKLPEVILLDVMLPGVDGWELLGRLREHPATQGVPVIVSTVMPQEQLALALGAADYLRKPVSREMLLSALDQQVSLQRKGSG
jgi:CheY-like chemotaxis protein